MTQSPPTAQATAHDETIRVATTILKTNYQHGYTMPSASIYPHQWLWDSCFHAIGLRHSDPSRALTELTTLLRGQWPNGMVPHMIFSSARGGHNHYNIWKSHICDDCVINLRTSAITQPPVITWAFEKVVEKLPQNDQLLAITTYLPQLIRYHEWMYRERDPEQTGRVVIIHPWESGLDNNPALVEVMNRYTNLTPIEKIMVTNPLFRTFYHQFRKDLRHMNSRERISTADSWMATRLIGRYRQKLYDIDSILLDDRSFIVEDVAFNSILIRSNRALQSLAERANVTLSDELTSSMARTEANFEDFWNEELGMFASRDWRIGQTIPMVTVAGLLPLITGTIPQSKAIQLVQRLGGDDFTTPWPVPSHGATEPAYDPVRYWQGPTWINMNWMIIQGLRSYKFDAEADALQQKTQELIETSGIWEYYNSQTGAGHGVTEFSWTAALYLDIVS